MFALLMNWISTNPWYGPVWFGAIADLAAVSFIVYFAVSIWKERKNG